MQIQFKYRFGTEGVAVNSDLNLLPNVAKFQALKIRLRQKVKLGSVIFCGVWAGLALTVIVLTLVFKTALTASEKELRRAQNEFNSLTEDIVLTQQIKYKAKVVGDILKNRFEYGRAFMEVGNLFKTVRIDNFDLGESGGLVIKGSGAGVKAIDEVELKTDSINRGESEMFASAKISSISFGDNIWRFTMEVKLK